MRAGVLSTLIEYSGLESGGGVKDRLAAIMGLHFLTHCPDVTESVRSVAHTMVPLLMSLIARVASPSAELRLGSETDVAALAATTLAHVASVLAVEGATGGLGGVGAVGGGLGS